MQVSPGGGDNSFLVHDDAGREFLMSLDGPKEVFAFSRQLAAARPHNGAFQPSYTISPSGRSGSYNGVPGKKNGPLRALGGSFQERSAAATNNKAERMSQSFDTLGQLSEGFAH